MKLCYTVATQDTADATMLALREPLPEAFAFLARTGYRAIELMVRDPRALEAGAITRAAGDYDIEIAAVSTGQLRKEDGLSFAHPDVAVRGAAVSRTRAVIDFAAELRAQVNIGSLRGNLGADRAASLERAVECFRAICVHAARCGVAVAVEPQSRQVVDWLNTVEETLSFARGLPEGPPGVLWDVYHATLEERSLYASLVRAGSAVLHVQFSDNHRGAPGTGHLPLGDLVRVLAALGYDRAVTVECLQRPDSRTAAARAAEHLRPYLEECAAGDFPR